MIRFQKPTNLNGAELLAELKIADVIVKGLPVVDENDDLLLEIDNKDKTKADLVVAAHDGTTTASELSIDEKLASVGLSVDNLKVALGL